MTTGALTVEQLMALWLSVTDSAYNQTLLENPDSGIELIRQAAEQLARTSQAVERTTQASYILPWSGQTNEPAQLGEKAVVDVKLARDSAHNEAITFIRGTQVQHETLDATDGGPEPVLTGRKYTVDEFITFVPGDSTTTVRRFTAEKQGYGYNNPLPGSIKRFVQVGGGMFNGGASIDTATGQTVVTCGVAPDVFVPEHVGQYLKITTGTQKGQIRRVAVYIPPPAPDDPLAALVGGQVTLVPTLIGVVTMLTGAFVPGEAVLQIDKSPTPGVDPDIVVGSGIFRGISNTNRLVIDVTGGTFLTGAPSLPYTTRRLYGQLSAATATLNTIEQEPNLLAETGIGWRILLWEADLGFSLANDESPFGGRSAMLEEIGYGRNLPILAGENEDDYRARIAVPVDVVSPNAIRRVCNRFFEGYGLEVELHEIGLPSFRGQYFDVDASASQFDPAFAFFFDQDSFYVTSLEGDPSNAFIEGERIRQYQDKPAIGAVAYGTALLGYEDFPPVVGPAGAWVLHAIVKGTCPPKFTSATDDGQHIYGETSKTSLFVQVGPGGLMPEHEFHLAMDNLERRAFFLVGVPYTHLGEFGCHYDEGLFVGFYDVPITPDRVGYYYDGFPLKTANIQKSLWNAVNNAKAAGVGFDLYPIRPLCIYPEPDDLPPEQ